MSRKLTIRLEAEITAGDDADIHLAASQVLAGVGIFLIRDGTKPDLHAIIDVPRGKAAYAIEEVNEPARLPGTT